MNSTPVDGVLEPPPPLRDFHFPILSFLDYKTIFFQPHQVPIKATPFHKKKWDQREDLFPLPVAQGTGHPVASSAHFEALILSVNAQCRIGHKFIRLGRIVFFSLYLPVFFSSILILLFGFPKPKKVRSKNADGPAPQRDTISSFAFHDYKNIAKLPRLSLSLVISIPSRSP